VTQKNKKESKAKARKVRRGPETSRETKGGEVSSPGRKKAKKDRTTQRATGLGRGRK